MSLPAPADRTATPAEFVDEALLALAGQPILAVITVPAPLAPLEALLRAAGERPAFLWDPPSGARHAGFGHAIALQASGPDRIARLAEQASALWPRVEHLCHPDAPRRSPRLFGGFAFAEGAASAAPWTEFGDARFVLPTWCYGRDGDQAWLSLAVDMAADADVPEQRRRWLAELERIQRSLSAPLGEPAPAPALVAMDELPRAAWRRGIEDIRRAIGEARCAKIVAARCSMVELAADIDPAAVLTRLARRHADCHRFAFRFGRATFVGATPERLIARFGDRVYTEALAGSIAAPGLVNPAAGPVAVSPASDEVRRAAETLLASGKDRDEQVLVVEAIERVLAPLCVHLEVPVEPEIRALRHVLHLRTPITGVLRARTHVLDLVSALHPTPAVGGEPTRAAMRWIAENEHRPRGWYAAPVGWFDADGDGEFAVAIRSGLLAGPRAHLYVGAGIVRDSDPDTEFDETRLKQQVMLGALGVVQ